MFSLEWGHGLWRSLVSALDWGSRGREFKSPQPDHKYPVQRHDLTLGSILTIGPVALAVAYTTYISHEVGCVVGLVIGLLPAIVLRQL